MRKKHQLKARYDCKILDLLGDKPNHDRLEASGVCIKNGCFYVIFDNLHAVAEIKELVKDSPNNRLIYVNDLDPGHYDGYEDITCNRNTGDFYLLIEALQNDKQDDNVESKIIRFNSESKRYKSCWVDPRIKVEGKDNNKGLEGLAWVNRGGTDFLIVLNEKTAGLYVCCKQEKQWECVTRIYLPSSVQFKDYSCLDIEENQILVASQESAKLWVGQLHDSGWGFVDQGKIYDFPDYYCNIEGVAWKTFSSIVAVSDKAKKPEQPDTCQCLDQSIHIFDLPGV